MNTEKFVVQKIGDDLYENKHLNFKGSRADAIDYAKAHNFGGGAEYYTEFKGLLKTKYTAL